MVAWFDEIVARNPAWGTGLTPLQVLLFNSNNAHSEFFHHLSALQPDDDEVREVYWHALVHGFAGQYYFEQGDAGELGKLKDLHAQQLPLRAAGARDPGRTTASPRSPTACPIRRARAIRSGASAPLLRAAGVLALLLPRPGCSRTVLPAPAPETRWRSASTSGCSATPAPTCRPPSRRDGATRVTGFVSEPEDIPRWSARSRRCPASTAAGFDLQLRYWPHCEVVSILKPYRARNRDKQAGLALVATTAREGRLREGDRVLLQVTNAKQESYSGSTTTRPTARCMHLHAGKGRRACAPASASNWARTFLRAGW